MGGEVLRNAGGREPHITLAPAAGWSGPDLECVWSAGGEPRRRASRRLCYHQCDSISAN